MEFLNQEATAVFNRLIDGLTRIGNAKKIDNTDGVFMPVSVEFIYENEHGKQFSVTHYYELNGDLMADPDMTFLVSAVDSRVYPLTFRQDGYPPVEHVAAMAIDGEKILQRAKQQQDITRFANMWMRNIQAQQGLG
jgi:hypothetical protein